MAAWRRRSPARSSATVSGGGSVASAFPRISFTFSTEEVGYSVTVPPARPGSFLGTASRIACIRTRKLREVSLERSATERDPMATYVMLSTLTPEGVQTIKNNPARIREVNKEIEQLGATVKAQWAVLGRFDFVNIVEAPDEKTMARVSLELGSRGTASYESLTAIPVDDFIASL